jgi:23S rRNA (guanosine2251-2'-O)-methyltransferase
MNPLERIPYLATAAAQPYEQLGTLPVNVLLDNVRSAYNVGAFFRTGDATAIKHLYLCGITGHPPSREVTKTALGAEETVPWSYAVDPLAVVHQMRQQGCQVAAIETNVRAVDLFDWKPHFPVCILFGNETDGLQPEVAAAADTYIRIPMLGRKHSLNVATAGGVVLFELLRKYRAMFNA